MPKKFRCKIGYKSRKKNIKVKWVKRCAVIAVAVTMMVAAMPWRMPVAMAVGCPDLKIIFARGSGGERFKTGHYQAFKSALEEKLKITSLKYVFDDLDYPAVSIDVSDGHLGTLIGAYVGGGEAYEFGDSVKAGVAKLVSEIKNDGCKNTKYVIGGYSQGALVVMNGLGAIDANKIVFAATFGDPKIYLPEGAGLWPMACSGRNLSEYRAYVPDCRAYKGLLGGKNPYVPSGFSGKVGTWCNRFDLMCSSHYSISSHTAYAEDGLYEDASRYIMSKIGAEFGITNKYTSPHDTVILIDSTGSMAGLIAKYKDEALRLAEKTLDAGGRVALYDYRDVREGYVPVERCNFDTCNKQTFRAGLYAIELDGGDDEPESLLSASLHVMKSLKWKFGSTKSLVILTDAGYHSPDLDGVTFYDVQKLSKQIDPVNIYVVTEEEQTETYRSLAEATGGDVASSVDELHILTDTIMERYDSLPRVEEEFEDENYDNVLPTLTVTSAVKNGNSVRISFENSGEKVVVILNEAVLGVTSENEVTIVESDESIKNEIMLVPLSATRRGESVLVEYDGDGRGGANDDGCGAAGRADESEVLHTEEGIIIPKAPNTGRR